MTFRALLRTDGDLIDTTGAIKHYLGGARPKNTSLWEVF